MEVKIPFRLKCLRILPSIALSGLILGIYSGYLATFVIPQILGNYPYSKFSEKEDQKNLGIIYISISGFFMFWLLVSLLKAAFIKPGQVPKGWHDLKFDLALQAYEMYSYRSEGGGGLYRTNMLNMDIQSELIEKDENLKQYLRQKGFRLCKACKIFKPERTHHCRQCASCVLKMDHHCNWLVNCIGFYNYKYFLVGLIHAVFQTIFATVTYSECFVDIVSHREKSLGEVLGISFTFIMTQSVVIIVGSFTFFHLSQLVGKGKTTIEFCEGNKGNHYNQGFCQNLKMTLGGNPLFWLQPFFPFTEGNGLKFDKNVICEDSESEEQKLNG